MLNQSTTAAKSSIRSYLNPAYLKNPIIIGTFFLTAAGIITKFIGFFYRIFLSRIFNEEGLGILGLISPVMMLVHSICAAGIQNAVTRFVAASKKEKTAEAYGFLFTGIAISVFLSGAMAYIVFQQAPFIAVRLIGERRCIPLLRISSLSFPLATIHSCMNGFFYGQKRAFVPAISMIIEQSFRVFTVYALYKLSVEAGANVSLSYICIGMLVGEFSSAFFSCFMLALRPGSKNVSIHKSISYRKGISILSLALPISLNKICISLISSVETIQLPKKLIASGLSSSAALSVYGVFSGMAFPLIMFPSALTSSISSLLLPSVSEAQAQGDTRRIRKTICLTVGFCFLLGVFCLLFFFLFADLIGKILFDSTVAAGQIRALSFVCPFLYISGALCSILHGLGKTGITFLFNVISLLLRLGFVYFAVPSAGFSGYIYGILCSQIFFDFLIILALKRYIIYN
ncbi:MAG: oligosaccharide flippase family protein [Lachnospiraceae bacterium]|nr:oligosaccharide flippase family protein [Lachnospiraceae bacterium]